MKVGLTSFTKQWSLELIRRRNIQEQNERLEPLRALRKEAAKKIDPKTAECMSVYGSLRDPYGEDAYLPPELDCSCRNNFVRAPGSDMWIWDGDLPEDMRDAVFLKRLVPQETFSLFHDEENAEEADD